MHCRKISRSFAIAASVVLALGACGTADKVTENELAGIPATGNSSTSEELQELTPLRTADIKDFETPAAQNPEPLTKALAKPLPEPLPAILQEPQPEPLNITLATLRAERGDVESQLALGYAYASGTPRVEKDPVQAKLWFELAALKGNSQAQYELGKFFYTGQGTDKDYFNAREWWIESALQGNLDAQHRLGYLYSEGLGVERDFEKAKLWYTKAARQGNAEAQTLLGSLYHEGNRIPTDYSEAFKWYKLAAEQGHAHAQYTLATLFHDGLGTQVDYIQCAAWVDVAIANGSDDEFRTRANCRAQLDELSNRTATHLAEVWKQRYVDTGI